MGPGDMRAAGAQAGPSVARLLTVDQVAQWLQVKPGTIYQWVHEGYIPVVKLGSLVRFSPGSVTQWIQKREAPGRHGRKLDLELT
jgi:excisionase family DNA binding protein